MKVRNPKRARRFGSRYSARLTSKYQARIPKEIRTQLQLESGDQMICELLQDGTVVVRKSSPLDLDYLEALSTTMNGNQMKKIKPIKIYELYGQRIFRLKI
jgi:antitoxin PrlF